jgi:DNA-binding transcriptional ArsR family regulator
MNPGADLAWIASVVGDPARARILSALMDRRARTAKELAFLARVAPATASAHLAKLLDCKLVSVEPQGRHRYFRLASALVAQMIEAIGLVAGDAPASAVSRSRVDETMATARTCYDHIAGRLGVAIADVLQDRGDVVFADGGGELTPGGRAFFGDLAIDLARFGVGRRIFCRPCLDWTERRYHLAGAVGAALCDHCLARGWLQRMRDTRALTISAEGRAAFADGFGIDTDLLAQSTLRATANAA